MSDLITVKDSDSILPEQGRDGTLACRNATGETYNNHTRGMVVTLT